MNHLQAYNNFTTLTQGIKNYKEALELTDTMGAGLYYVEMKKDCEVIRMRLEAIGASPITINRIESPFKIKHL